MSTRLESLLTPEQRAACEANDTLLACCTHRCYEGQDCPNQPAPLPFTTQRFPRTSGEAFRDDSYVVGWEPHIAPRFWQRVRLFFKRRFAS